ncbi:MAG: F0F1 ATP synthase subunit epsilon [Gammaproteobacteria bacterium]|nr:F0F1 ATP synthase subunit epsilon [Gammaproteobacteria bacterium]
MSTIHVDIVSAEREIFSGEAAMVFAPAILGEVGIAPGHAAMLTRMGPGEVRVQLPSGEQQAFYVSGGMLEVLPKVVTVLSDTAVRAHDLDEAAVLKAKQQAEESLKDRSGKLDLSRAQAELAELAAQLQTIQRLRRRGG